MTRISLEVNGQVHVVEADPDTPLLYVLRNDLGLNGPKFGCGLGQCGSCEVLADGRPLRSCLAPVGNAAESKITTLEGLGSRERPHALQSAFIAEQALQASRLLRNAGGTPAPQFLLAFDARSRYITVLLEWTTVLRDVSRGGFAASR